MIFKLKVFFVVIWFFISALLGLLYALLRPRRVQNGNDFSRVLLPIVPKTLGMEIKQLGRENIPKAPFVIISNHQHNLDYFIVGPATPDKTFSLGKKSLKWMPLFGWLYWFCGHEFIDRKNRKKAYAALEKIGRKCRKQKSNILIFAEGTRNHGKGLLPFKKGAFHLAKQANLPIHMMIVDSYADHMHVLKDGGKLLVEVRFLETISLEEVRSRSVEDLKSQAEKVFRDNIKPATKKPA